MHRCIRPQIFGNIVETSLHHFSDASGKGYGQCSYIIQLVNDESKIHRSLLVGKTRVTQKKFLLIPRLVLTAAVLSTKMSCHVMSYKNATSKSMQCNYMMYLKIENQVSDWCKLKRAITTSYMTTSYEIVPGSHSFPGLQSVQMAESVIIKASQRRYFSCELEILEKERILKKKSSIYMFDAYLYRCGLLRSGGQIQKSVVSEVMKHPQGCNLTLTRQFWVTKVCLQVSKIYLAAQNISIWSPNWASNFLKSRF